MRFFRLNAINQVGGFDTGIKGAGEDHDISIRLKNIGWKFAVNDEAKYHRKYRPDTFGAVWRKNFWYGSGRHFLYHKYKNNIVYRSTLFFRWCFGLVLGLL